MLPTHAKAPEVWQSSRTLEKVINLEIVSVITCATSACKTKGQLTLACLITLAAVAEPRTRHTLYAPSRHLVQLTQRQH